MTSPLIPWNSCGAYMAATLGVATTTYVPFAFFNLINPLIAIAFGFLGLRMLRTTVAAPEVKRHDKKLKGVRALYDMLAVGPFREERPAMPRKPRFKLAGMPVHVVQRGNNRQAVFYDEQDHRAYLRWLEEGAERYGCAVHAYVLMTNHVHLLLTPEREGATGRLLQYLGRYYVLYINHRYGRSGTLWEGRYKASLIQEEDYLLACYRYIELNPVRAGMVEPPWATTVSKSRWRRWWGVRSATPDAEGRKRPEKDLVKGSDPISPLDGLYVLRTSVPKEMLQSAETVRAYKDLAHVERAFRSYKSV
ncbi:MAG: transposase, partial [Candidatus Rokuibacteriota bacterium]